jgi:hypothetical protein
MKNARPHNFTNMPITLGRGDVCSYGKWYEIRRQEGFRKT